MSDLQKLIERLENLDAPCRECDAEIACLIYTNAYMPDHSKVSSGHYWQTEGIDETLYRAEQYTDSIDAAITLIPDGWEWSVSNRARAPHYGRAYIHNKESVFAGIAANPNPKRRVEEETAFNPTIALCIAALRARQSQ